MSRTCKTCRFWDSGDRWGECKRRAPASMTDQVWGQWPKTSADNWCGDFEETPVPLEDYLQGVAKRETQDRLNKPEGPVT